MKYCSECGAKVEWRLPEGDNRERHVCIECNTIHYQNPKIVAGCLPVWQNKILLCKRAIEPRYGLWTLPAGYMENAETTVEAAMRETREEACANVEVVDLFTMLSLPHINQVYMMYRADLIDENFSPGCESLETRLFAEHEIPWKEIAFPVITTTLEIFFADRKQGAFGIHTGDMVRIPDQDYAFRLNRLKS
jgi:ADP-ribose pyrophosphatase YjhB (NUDIX family)